LVLAVQTSSTPQGRELDSTREKEVEEEESGGGLDGTISSGGGGHFGVTKSAFFPRATSSGRRYDFEEEEQQVGDFGNIWPSKCEEGSELGSDFRVEGDSAASELTLLEI